MYDPVMMLARISMTTHGSNDDKSQDQNLDEEQLNEEHMEENELPYVEVLDEDDIDKKILLPSYANRYHLSKKVDANILPCDLPE